MSLPEIGRRWRRRRPRGVTRGLAYGEEHRARMSPSTGARPPQALIVRLAPGGVNGNRLRLNRLSERPLREMRGQFSVRGKEKATASSGLKCGSETRRE